MYPDTKYTFCSKIYQTTAIKIKPSLFATTTTTTETTSVTHKRSPESIVDKMMKFGQKQSISIMKHKNNVTMLVFMIFVLLDVLPLFQPTMTFYCLAIPDDDGLATVPPMGWNNLWVHYIDVSENDVKEAADQLAQSGLRDLGYRYVNIDDCWMARERDAVTHQLVPNATTFPSGMPALADYLHQRGFKFGVYSSAGTMTCTQFPGSLNYEELDAQTFASWGVDLLKYDNCYGDGTPDVVRHSKMRNALLATKRPIFFSLCTGGQNNVWQWASQVGHMFRSTVDIQPNWNNIYSNFWNNQRHLDLLSKFSHTWSDPDMLQIGSYNFGGRIHLTFEEQKSQFGLWVLAKAPLLLSTNVAQLKANETLFSVVSNTRLIEMHQNPNYPPARCYVGCRTTDVTIETKKMTNTIANTGHQHLFDVSDDIMLPYSILATSNVLDKSLSDSQVTVAIIMNWSQNQTLTNVAFYTHDVGVVPIVDTSNNHNRRLVVTDLWTGKVVMTTLVKATDDNDYKPIQIVVPSLKPHDNVIYRIETISELVSGTEEPVAAI